MIVLHVIIALASMVAATASLALISKKMLIAARALSLLTLATGSMLIAMFNAPILATCLEGIAYLSVVMVIMAFAKRRIIRAGVPSVS